MTIPLTYRYTGFFFFFSVTSKTSYSHFPYELFCFSSPFCSTTLRRVTYQVCLSSRSSFPLGPFQMGLHSYQHQAGSFLCPQVPMALVTNVSTAFSWVSLPPSHAPHFWDYVSRFLMPSASSLQGLGSVLGPPVHIHSRGDSFNSWL